MRPPRRFLSLLVVLAACGPSDAVSEPDEPAWEPPPESCTAPSLTEPTTFATCSTGSAVFGQWTLDADGLPGYDYHLDQHRDARASWLDTEDNDRRDQWASFGNGRVTALASTDGFIEVTTQDRGATYLDKVDEASHAYGGGFSFIDDGAATWTTAYKYRPRGARTTRRFGMGYAESTMIHRDVFVGHRLYAPPGDATYVLDDVAIENRGTTPKTLRHYEYWDVRRRPLEAEWLVAGKPFASAPKLARQRRDARNAAFDEQLAWDPAGRLLGMRRTHAASTVPAKRTEASAVDWYPGDPFLAVVEGEATDVYTDDARFFGDADPSGPRAVVDRAAGEIDAIDASGRSGANQPRMFVVRTDVTLAPGERKTLRFAYGYTSMGDAWPDLSSTADAFTARKSELEKHLLYLATDRDAYLHRELAWHASQIEASVSYREYWGRHVVPQGSAYLYLHGVDGALRDTALFALPLVYTHPELAREELALAMGLAFAADSRFSYAFQGHGVLDNALGLHSQPSDLDLFFLLAIHEYLGATGDIAFLDEKISYWPRATENEATTRDHIRRAVVHLLDGVGFGEHGLIHVGTGDWSDGVVASGAPDRTLAIAKGESIPNSQMALSVLPAIADLLEASDAALAARIRDACKKLSAAVETTWVESFYGRAYFGDGILRGNDAIDLEAQVWPLIGPLAREVNAPRSLLPDHGAHLAATIRKDLDDPSPVGAPLRQNGEVWPAIAQLLTWGYTRVDDELAWSHLAKMSLAARAKAYPDLWYHVWSGPDGANAATGKTWSSPVTPMTDFPTMNANVHSLALLAALRVAGVEARAEGLSIMPHAPHPIALRTALVDLDVESDRIRAVWRPAVGVPRSLELAAPRGATLGRVRVDGATFPTDAGATRVTLPVTATSAGVVVEATLGR